MRRGLPLLFCVLALFSSVTATAAADPFVLPPRIDYAGLRCITGTGRVALVVGVHYGDVKQKYESVAFLVRHVGHLEARLTGRSGSQLLLQTERLPVALVDRRNVDHRHTIFIGTGKLARATQSSACSSGFHLKVRVTQKLKTPGESAGGTQANDLPPSEERKYNQLLADMAADDTPGDFYERFGAVARTQSALSFNGCIFQRRSRCPGANLAGTLVDSRATTGGAYVMGYGVSVSRIDLRGATLDGASLAGVAMNAAQLQGVVARGLQLSGSSLLGASVAGADLTGAVGSASWTTEHVLVPPFPAILQGANAARANFAGAALKGATLSNGRFSGTDFTGADLSQADLSGANLRGTDFTNADLSGATLLGADATGANFKGANLSNTIDPAGERLPPGTVGTEDESTGLEGRRRRR